MKSKILIPMMAFVFAIGMSFTTEKPIANLWIDLGGGIAEEVLAPECVIGDKECLGQFEEGGPTHRLYYDEQLNNPVPGSGDVVHMTIINP